MSKIPRRQFIQLTAVAAAGCFVRPGREAAAQDLPKLEESDQAAKDYKYTHDASTVDPESRPRPAEDQTCLNCSLLQGEEGAEWRPCLIFQGKLVHVDGWCSVWTPKT